MGGPVGGGGLLSEECWGGKGGRLPEGVTCSQAVTGPGVMGSVWKAALRELEGTARPGTPTEDSLANQNGGIWRYPHMVPTQVWEDGEVGLGVQREPGTFWRLGKADSQGHPALAVLPQKATQRPGVGVRAETPGGHLGGQFLKEVPPQAGCRGEGRCGGLRGSGISTTRLQGGRERPGLWACRPKLGVTCGKQGQEE